MAVVKKLLETNCEVCSSQCVFSFALRLIPKFYLNLVQLRAFPYSCAFLKRAILTTGGNKFFVEIKLSSFYSQRYTNISCGTIHEQRRSSHHGICFNTGLFIIRCCGYLHCLEQYLGAFLYSTKAFPLLRHGNISLLKSNLQTSCGW